MIQIVKGSDPRLVVTLQQQDDSGIMPLNITSTMVVKCVYRDLVGIKTKSSEDPTQIEIVDAVYGKVIVNFGHAETDKFKVGAFDFDVYVIEDDKDLIWQFIGEVTVVDKIR